MDYGTVLKIILLFSGWILYLSYFKVEQRKGEWSNSSVNRVWERFFFVYETRRYKYGVLLEVDRIILSTTFLDNVSTGGALIRTDQKTFFLQKWTGQKILDGSDNNKTKQTKVDEPLIFLARPYKRRPL